MARRVPDLQSAVWDVTVDETVRSYIVRLVRATRDHFDLFAGRQPARQPGPLQSGAGAGPPSTAATLCCPTTSSCWRPQSVLGHRLIVKPESALRGRESGDHACATSSRRSKFDVGAAGPRLRACSVARRKGSPLPAAARGVMRWAFCSLRYPRPVSVVASRIQSPFFLLPALHILWRLFRLPDVARAIAGRHILSARVHDARLFR
jgi:hypothetical protein